MDKTVPAKSLPLAPAPECPSPSADKIHDREEAGIWFSKAEQLVNEKKFDKAMSAFMCSFQLVAHPNTLFNTAQAAALRGDTALARELLEIYLSKVPQGELADLAGEQLAELGKEKVGTAREAESTPLPSPTPVVEPDLRGLPPAVRETAAAATTRRIERVLGYSLLAGAGALSIAGGVLQIVAGVNQQTALDAATAGEFEDERDKMRGTQTAAIVCFVAGGVTAVASGVLLVLGYRKRRVPVNEKISRIAPRISGLGLDWRF